MKRKIVVALLMSLVLVGCSKSQDAEIQEHITELQQLEEERQKEDLEESQENNSSDDYSETEDLPMVSAPISDDDALDSVEDEEESEESVSEGSASEDTQTEESDAQDDSTVDGDESVEETSENHQYDVVEVTAILDDYFATTEDTVSTFADKYCVVPYNVVPAAPYGVTEYSVGIVELKSGNIDDYTYTCSFHGLCSDYKGMFDRDGVVTFKFHGTKLYDASTEYDL